MGVLMSDTIRKRTAAVTPRGVNHLVLNVRDIEESHRFWCDLLGFKQVGELHPRADGIPSMTMRFYSGVVDDVNHHDVALVQRPGLPAPPAEWSMFEGACAINHIAITYPDRESWLEQVQFLKDSGVNMNLRVNHGMTHSVYINDPNGYGVEVLYDLPVEVWQGDIDGALNYAQVLPPDQLLVDTTDYETDFSRPAAH
jgi:catechol 2,3-dioxygenase-like lactoylglutathione lyase family enzyme